LVLYVFQARNIVNFLIIFIFLTATYLSKALYSLFVLKVPLNFNQSELCVQILQSFDVLGVDSAGG